MEVDRSSILEGETLRSRIRQVGMRNSNGVAIAPTVTIANIVGISAGIEPEYRNLYVKSNLAGEFTAVNEALVEALKTLGLWDEVGGRPQILRRLARPNQAASRRRPHRCPGQARDQRPDRRQSMGVVQITMGLGEIPDGLRQSLENGRCAQLGLSLSPGAKERGPGGIERGVKPVKYAKLRGSRRTCY